MFKPDKIVDNPEENKPLHMKIKDELRSISFIPEELAELFDAKYKNANFSGITLLDKFGSPVLIEENKRKFIDDFDKIDYFDKQNHFRGLIYNLENTSVGFIEKLSEEKELLDMAEKKGVKLRGMIEEKIREDAK